MMKEKFPGTAIANQVLASLPLEGHKLRLYSEVRKNGRTYKIWGVFSDSDLTKIMESIKKVEGVRNVREARSSFYRKLCGVRFEMDREFEEAAYV